MYTRPSLTINDLIEALTAMRDGLNCGHYPAAVSVMGVDGFTTSITSVLAPPVFLADNPTQPVVILACFPPEDHT